MGSNSNTDISFEQSLKELESILAELEDSQTPLDEMVAKYERAKKCLEICRKKLEAAELSVKKLSKNGAEDFDVEND